MLCYREQESLTGWWLNSSKPLPSWGNLSRQLASKLIARSHQTRSNRRGSDTRRESRRVGKTGAAASLRGKAPSKFPDSPVEGVAKRPPSGDAWPGRSARRRHQQSRIQPQVPSPAGGLVAAAHYYRSASCQVSNGPPRGLEFVCPRESRALELYPSRRTGFWLLFHQGESPARDTSAGAHRIMPFGPPSRPSEAAPKIHLLRKELQPDPLPGAAAAAIPPEKRCVVTGELLSLHPRKRNCGLLAA